MNQNKNTLALCLIFLVCAKPAYALQITFPWHVNCMFLGLFFGFFFLVSKVIVWTVALPFENPNKERSFWYLWISQLLFVFWGAVAGIFQKMNLDIFLLISLPLAFIAAALGANSKQIAPKEDSKAKIKD